MADGRRAFYDALAISLLIVGVADSLPLFDPACTPLKNYKPNSQPAKEEKQYYQNYCFTFVGSAMGAIHRNRDDINAVSTLAVALFTAILAAFTVSLSRSTKIAAIAARDAAEALPALERAHVFAAPEMRWEERVLKVGSEPVHVATVHCTLANFGRTPAISWSFEWDARPLSKHLPEPDNTIPSFGHEMSFRGGQLLLVQEGTPTITSPSHWTMMPNDFCTLSKEEWKDFKNADFFIWFYARAIYEDVFGTLHQTRFRWFYNGLSDQFGPYGGAPYNQRT